MNERITALAEQAVIAVRTENFPDLPPLDDAMIEKILALREYYDAKFAELIIRDCIVQLGEAIPDTNCSASGAYKTAKIAATTRIEQHFGVE